MGNSLLLVLHAPCAMSAINRTGSMVTETCGESWQLVSAVPRNSIELEVQGWSVRDFIAHLAHYISNLGDGGEGNGSSQSQPGIQRRLTLSIAWDWLCSKNIPGILRVPVYSTV